MAKAGCIYRRGTQQLTAKLNNEKLHDGPIVFTRIELSCKFSCRYAIKYADVIDVLFCIYYLFNDIN